MGGRDRYVGTAEGLVTQGQIPVVVVVVTWVAGCAAVVYPSHRRGLFFPLGSHGQIVGVNEGPVLIGEDVLAGCSRVLGASR